MNKKMLLQLWLVVVLILGIFTPVVASGSHLFVVNVSGESDGYSLKDIRSIGNGTEWAADIVTYTDYPPASVSLGWNYFTAIEKCGGTVKNILNGSPTYVYSSEIADTIFIQKADCSNQRTGQVYGKHIISASDGTNYYDEWVDEEVVN